MNNFFEFSSIQNGNVLIKSWVYPNSNEMDLEIWIDGAYSQTITVDLLKRDAI